MRKSVFLVVLSGLLCLSACQQESPTADSENATCYRLANGTNVVKVVQCESEQKVAFLVSEDEIVRQTVPNLSDVIDVQFQPTKIPNFAYLIIRSKAENDGIMLTAVPIIQGM